MDLVTATDGLTDGVRGETVWQKLVAAASADTPGMAGTRKEASPALSAQFGFATRCFFLAPAAAELNIKDPACLPFSLPNNIPSHAHCRPCYSAYPSALAADSLSLSLALTLSHTQVPLLLHLPCTSLILISVSLNCIFFSPRVRTPSAAWVQGLVYMFLVFHSLVLLIYS